MAGEALRTADWRLCVRGHRDAQGLSAADVARHVGISRAHMWNIETGRKQPTVPVAERLAKALGMTLAELLGHAAAASPAVAGEDGGGLRASQIAVMKGWAVDPKLHPATPWLSLSVALAILNGTHPALAAALAQEGDTTPRKDES